MGSKVLFISHDANRAGSQLLLLQLIALLANKGVSTHLLLCDGGELIEKFSQVTELTLINKAPGSRLKTLVARALKRIPGLRHSRLVNSKNNLNRVEKELSRHEFGLVFVNSVANAGVYKDSLPFLHSLPLVVFAHELKMSVATYTNTAHLRFLLSKCQHLIAVSRAVADFYIKDYGYPASRVSTFTLINTREVLSKLTCAKGTLSDELPGIPSDALVIGGCGNAEWRKGNDIFNLIAREVIEQTAPSPIYFVWVGAGPSQPFYELIRFDIERFGLTNRIILVPPTAKALDIMTRFDIFLLSSREDPYPLVVLEAALLKKPIVCFDEAGGAPELVEEDAGAVVGYLDVAGAARAIVSLIENPEKRKSQGQRAYEKVLARHNTEQSIQKVLTILDESMAPPVNPEIHS